MTTIANETRLEALRILKGLAQHLYSLTADIFYDALHEEGFNDDEKVRLVGACIRTASSRGWITRTEYSTKSRRNSSNLQTVWRSDIFRQRNGGGELEESDIRAAYNHWQAKGHKIPDHLVVAWEQVENARKLFPDLSECRVTQPPNSGSYGAVVKR